jgi:hypothetical protein
MDYIKLLSVVAAGVTAACLIAAPAKAETISYVLTFTPTGGAATGGTGLLTLNEPSLPTNLSINGSSSQFVSLSATVDGIAFAFANSDVYSLGMSGGVWNNISAMSNDTTDGSFQFYIGTGGLTYNLQEVNVGEPGYGNISVGAPQVVSATPLPSTLPLFAAGLSFVGYLTGRKKRRAAFGLVAA